MSFPICEKCLTGCLLPGDPTGELKKTKSGIDYYVASPPEDKKKRDKCLVLFTDIFGLNFKNNRLLADMIAERGGYYVYVPDIFQGDFIAWDSLPIAVDSIGAKLRVFAKLTTLLPFIYRHRTAVTLPIVKQFMNDLKDINQELKDNNQMDENVRIGVTGYCFGGLYSVYLGADPEMAVVGFACHPSMLNESVIQDIKIPFGFVVAEVDNQFPPSFADKAQVILDAKKIPNEFTLYHGTEHGFAARPNFENETVRIAFFDAIEKTLAFFEKHL